MYILRNHPQGWQAAPTATRALDDEGAPKEALRPISLLRLSLLRFLDSNFPASSLWTLEFNPLKFRFCLSQTLRNPES